MRTLKQISKVLILIVGMILTFNSCQKETISDQKSDFEYRIRKLTFDEIKEINELTKPIKLLDGVLDINTKDKDVPNSFVIETEQIIELVEGNNVTYSFKILNPTDSSSMFENFIIDISDPSETKYFIFKYKLRDTLGNGGIPYEVSIINLSEYQIEINDFTINLTKDICIEYIEYEVIEPSDFESSTTVVEVLRWYVCAGGGGGSNSGNDFGDSGINNGNNNNSGNSVGSGGGSSSGSGNVGGHVAVNFSDVSYIESVLTNLTPEQIALLYNPNYEDEVSQIAQFLYQNQNSQEALEFAYNLISNSNISIQQLTNLLNFYNIYGYEIANEVFEIINNDNDQDSKLQNLINYFENSTPIISSPNQSDYETAIMNMTNYMKQFGGNYYVPFANYVQSLIPDFLTFTMGDVNDIYVITRSVYNEIRAQYILMILKSAAELTLPYLTYAIGNIISPMASNSVFNRIPYAFVTRGTKLEQFVLATSKLGQAGTYNSRIISGSSFAKAERLFYNITKDAISIAPASSNSSVIVANMGNNMKIILRPMSTTVPDAVAVIEYQNFNSILNTASYTLKFLP